MNAPTCLSCGEFRAKHMQNDLWFIRCRSAGLVARRSLVDCKEPAAAFDGGTGDEERRWGTEHELRLLSETKG